MSVYTSVEQHPLEVFLSHYNLGKLVDYKGISAGIENTNYFVTTTTGEFVLTIFEQMTDEEVPYFLELMAYMDEHQVPSPHPQPDNEKKYLRRFYDKPAALVKRLSGHDVRNPNSQQCQALGVTLGHLHTVAPGFHLYRANPRGPHWWKVTAEKVMPHLNDAEKKLLQEEIHFQSTYQHFNLPRGVIHADLFRDNALFDGNVLSGLIDFYYACDDVLLYDVAITVNDWCSLENGELDSNRLHSLLDAYQHERPFTEEERKVWHVMLRAAALRFWLSRLHDLHFPREGELTHTKNPNEFKNILLARLDLPSDCNLP